MPRPKRERTERTPKGLEVRIPKRCEIFDNLKKLAQPKRDDSATRRRPSK